MSLERVVRPFQTRDVSPPKRVHTQYETEDKPVEVEIGKGSGSGKSLQGSINFSVSYYMDTRLKEPRRFIP